MNQTFKLSFDKSHIGNENNGKVADGTTVLENKQYEQEGYNRNVCFVKEDGSRIFLSYSHLITGVYQPDENSIELTFTSHIVYVKGAKLESLYYQLMSQVVKQLVCTDPRYNLLSDDNIYVINELSWIEKE